MKQPDAICSNQLQLVQVCICKRNQFFVGKQIGLKNIRILSVLQYFYTGIISVSLNKGIDNKHKS